LVLCAYAKCLHVSAPNVWHRYHGCLKRSGETDAGANRAIAPQPFPTQAALMSTRTPSASQLQIPCCHSCQSLDSDAPLSGKSTINHLVIWKDKFTHRQTNPETRITP
jgi:hypothetical protein